MTLFCYNSVFQASDPTVCSIPHFGNISLPDPNLLLWPVFPYLLCRCFSSLALRVPQDAVTWFFLPLLPPSLADEATGHRKDHF